MDNIVIIGGGGNAKVLINIIRRLNKFEILGYTDVLDKGQILGIKYLGKDSVLESIIKVNRNCYAALGIGQINISDNRKIITDKVLKLGYDFPIIISENAIVNEDVSIQKGTVVFDGSVINSGTRIGKFCIINTNSTVEHDCIINDFIHIAPGVTIGGGVEIGEGSFIGLGAGIIPYKKITKNCIIGAGSVVTKDCKIEGTYIGIPAKMKK
jgi:UDP-perosamine 4-acetyltransferase